MPQRQLTKEEINRCYLKWQQLRNEHGKNAANVPEFIHLTKILHVAAKQQQEQKQKLQQQQQQQQQQQHQHHQQQQQQQVNNNNVSTSAGGYRNVLQNSDGSNSDLTNSPMHNNNSVGTIDHHRGSVISIESSINGNNSNPNSSPLDQHQNHLHSMPNSAGKCFAPLPTGVSPLANNVVLSSSSNNPLALDMNDPDTLEIYSQLLLFKDREHLYTELIYPSGIANSLRRILDLCCSALGLIESSDPNFITIRRKTNNYDFQKQLGESSGTMVDHGMIDQPLNSTSTGGESLSSSQSYTSLSNTRLSLSLVNSTNTSDYIPTMNQHGISKSTALFPQAVTNDSPNVRYANSASGQSGSSILHASSYMDPHNQTSTTSSGINISGFFNGRSSSISGQGMSSNYMLQRQRVPVPFFSNQNNSDLRVNGYNSQKSTKIGVMGAGQGLGPHLTNGSTVSAATNMTTNYGIIQGNELFNEYEQQPPISRGIW